MSHPDLISALKAIASSVNPHVTERCLKETDLPAYPVCHLNAGHGLDCTERLLTELVVLLRAARLAREPLEFVEWGGPPPKQP